MVCDFTHAQNSKGKRRRRRRGGGGTGRGEIICGWGWSHVAVHQVSQGWVDGWVSGWVRSEGMSETHGLGGQGIRGDSK